MTLKSVIWPDFAKLPIGLFISIVGIALGILVRKKQDRGS